MLLHKFPKIDKKSKHLLFNGKQRMPWLRSHTKKYLIEGYKLKAGQYVLSWPTPLQGQQSANLALFTIQGTSSNFRTVRAFEQSLDAIITKPKNVNYNLLYEVSAILEGFKIDFNVSGDSITVNTQQGSKTMYFYNPTLQQLSQFLDFAEARIRLIKHKNGYVPTLDSKAIDIRAVDDRFAPIYASKH